MLNNVNIVSAAEMYILKWSVLHYVYFTTKNHDILFAFHIKNVEKARLNFILPTINAFKI